MIVPIDDGWRWSHHITWQVFQKPTWDIMPCILPVMYVCSQIGARSLLDYSADGVLIYAISHPFLQLDMFSLLMVREVNPSVGGGCASSPSGAFCTDCIGGDDDQTNESGPDSPPPGKWSVLPAPLVQYLNGIFALFDDFVCLCSCLNLNLFVSWCNLPPH